MAAIRTHALCVNITKRALHSARTITLAKRFDGMPKQNDFKMVEEQLPPLKEGEFLAEAVYLSVDPYMRAYSDNIPIGGVMVGTQVARITESKDQNNFPVGKHVVGKFDWRTHTIFNSKEPGNTPVPTIIPDLGDLPLSYSLGVLGMPGNTAYFGFLDICKPKSGEVVAVSGAAGAVGSIVGQIAKLKGCKVIGIAGSDDKGKYLVNEFGFDAFVNYKTDNFLRTLRKSVPEGIDCYFDNVSGEISLNVMRQMNKFGRVSVCGSISYYNHQGKEPPRVTVIQPVVVHKELRVQGFRIVLYEDRAAESFQNISQWIKEGKIKYKETVTEGFDNMVQAFIDMLQGKNLGKAVVKV